MAAVVLVGREREVNGERADTAHMHLLLTLLDVAGQVAAAFRRDNPDRDGDSLRDIADAEAALRLAGSAVGAVGYAALLLTGETIGDDLRALAERSDWLDGLADAAAVVEWGPVKRKRKPPTPMAKTDIHGAALLWWSATVERLEAIHGDLESSPAALADLIPNREQAVKRWAWRWTAWTTAGRSRPASSSCQSRGRGWAVPDLCLLVIGWAAPGAARLLRHRRERKTDPADRWACRVIAGG